MGVQLPSSAANGANLDTHAPDMSDEGDGATLRTVNRTLAVLLAFSREQPSLGVTELSDRLGLTKSTIHRILRSLMAYGMVAQDPHTREYSLGYRVLALASNVPGDVNLRQVCQPHMQWLRSTTEETIGLHVIAGDVRMCLDELESPQLLRMAAGVGRCFSLDRGAASKALLADGPASGDTWRRATAQLSVERLAQLQDDIESLRQHGFAMTRGETVDGSSSIAAPLRSGGKGPVVAAVSVAGPLSRFSDERVATYAPLLLEAAARITRDLGALYAMPQGVGSR